MIIAVWVLFEDRIRNRDPSIQTYEKTPLNEEAYIYDPKKFILIFQIQNVKEGTY